MNVIARLLSGRQTRSAQQLVIVKRDPCRVRMDEWRTEPGLVKLATKLLSDPNLSMMIDVLRNEHLSHYVLPMDAPLEQRAILQARSEGYGTCLANLESLAVLSQKQETLEATYEEPEDDKQTKPKA